MISCASSKAAAAVERLDGRVAEVRRLHCSSNEMIDVHDHRRCNVSFSQERRKSANLLVDESTRDTGHDCDVVVPSQEPLHVLSDHVVVGASFALPIVSGADAITE